MLSNIVEELTDPGSRICRLQPAARTRLHAAVALFHTNRVAPAAIVDELCGVAVFTSHEPHGRLRLAKPAIHGPSGALHAMMSFACRTYRDADSIKKRTEQETEALRATVAMFLPLLERCDTLVTRLPAVRQTLFRGLAGRVRSRDYLMLGQTVAWHAMASTTEDLEVARDFGTATIFIAHVHGAGSIDFCSVFNEKEALLPSYAVLRSMGMRSPTVLRMLNVGECDIVQVQQIGDEQQTAAQTVARMEASLAHLEKLHRPFLRTYVEARVAPNPPPLPVSATTSLTAAITDLFFALPPTRHKRRSKSKSNQKQQRQLPRHGMCCC